MRRFARTFIIGTMIAVGILCAGFVVADAVSAAVGSAPAQARQAEPLDVPGSPSGQGEPAHCHPDLKADPAGLWTLTVDPAMTAGESGAGAAVPGHAQPPASPPPRSSRQS